ncbi:MAG: glycosyltransferase [Patescibacteria group bacterium]
MNKIMLSIIIPTLNEEKRLPLVLENLKKQTFQNFEIVVADAGSADKTVEIAKSFGCIITNGGLPAKGRNEGAKVAKGDIFLFLDSDHIFIPNDFLEKLLKEFNRRNLDIASFPISVRGNWFDGLVYWLYNNMVNSTQSFMAHAYSSALVRREIHEKIGGYDEKIKFAEDQSYAKHAARVGKFGFINIEPVITSLRRIERDGRFPLYSKCLWAGIYLIFIGDIKSDIFRYRFGYYSNEENK